MLLRKIKIKLPLTAEKKNAKSLETLWSDGYCAKTNKDKNFKFSAFQRNIYRLNLYTKRFFVKNTGWPTDRRKGVVRKRRGTP